MKTLLEILGGIAIMFVLPRLIPALVPQAEVGRVLTVMVLALNVQAWIIVQVLGKILVELRNAKGGVK